MLPDDLENLAQSIIATNFFANNILQAITTRNYWDVVNEYKPLMHTWSLGVEEQFYLIYPLLFLFAQRFGTGYLLPAIAFISAVSLLLFLAPFPDYQKFYYLPFRLFELSAGGLVAIVQTKRPLAIAGSGWAVASLLLILSVNVTLPSTPALLVTVVLTCLVASTIPAGKSVHALLLENHPAVFLGKISFSLFMWHQVVFAFARYCVFEDLHGWAIALSMVLVFALSVFSYEFIEQPFRNGEKCSVGLLLAVVLGFSFATTAIAGWLYLRAGVVRDVPELAIVDESVQRGMHAQYNHRIDEYDRAFGSSGLKVLVIGNSFARDWANVLLESQWASKLDLSYLPNTNRRDQLRVRWEAADVVFWSTATAEAIKLTGQDQAKLYVVGTKNFGKSAGVFYNYRGAGYFEQKALPDSDFVSANLQAKQIFGERYIDLMNPVMDNEGRVHVFTPSGKLISQDCRHLTQAGARHYAQLLSGRLDQILGDGNTLR